MIESILEERHTSNSKQCIPMKTHEKDKSPDDPCPRLSSPYIVDITYIFKNNKN